MMETDPLKQSKSPSDLQSISDKVPPSYGTFISPKRFLKSSPTLNVGKVVHLAIGFMLMFTAWNGIQNILSLVLKQLGYPNLGIIALLTVNFSLGTASTIAPRYAATLPYRFTFALSSFATLIFMGACLLIASCTGVADSKICSSASLYTIMIVACLVTGLTMAVLWVTQSVYVTECSNDDNKGQFFGTFWSILQISQFTGNLLASIFYTAWGAEGLFAAFSILVVVSTAVLVFLPDPEGVEYEVTDAEGRSAIVKAYDNGSDDLDYTWDRTFNMIISEKFRAFIPMISVVAALCVMYISFLATLTEDSLGNVQSTALQNERLGYVMFTLGAGEVAAGQIFGYLIDYSKRVAVIAQYSVIFLSFVAIAIAFETNRYWIYFLVAAGFGLSDSGSQTIIGALLAGKFTEKYEQFAAFRTVGSLLVALFYLIDMLVGPEISIIIFLVVILFAVIMLRNLFSYI